MGVFGLALLSTVATAQPAASTTAGRRTTDRGVVGLTFENDSFADTDHNYTSGVTLSWFSAPGGAPRKLSRTLRSTPLLSDEGETRLSLVVGHNMFTPDDIEATAFQREDRPYAAWLYGRMGIAVETGDRLDHLEVMAGVVGPAAQGEAVQGKVHEWSNSRPPNGWDNQLANEPGLGAIWRRTWRLPTGTASTGWGFEALPYVGGSLGNIYTNASAGAAVRGGRDLAADYGPQGVRPNLSGAGFFRPAHRVSGYAFAGVEGSAVARNLFLDGNTFQDGPGVDKNVLLGAAEAGVALYLFGVRLSYSHQLRSPEYLTQDGPDDYGSLTVSARL